MRQSRAVAGGVLAMLLAVGSTGLLPRRATPQQLAQVIPDSVTGQLDENSQTMQDGRYITVHPYEGTAGETVTFELVSEDFDIAVLLLSPSGEYLGFDDDSGDGTNAQLTIELPETGTYQVGIISFNPGEIGEYTLSWRSATATDLALQRASQLNRQAIELYQQGRYSDAEPLFEESLTIRQEQLGERHPDVATTLNNLATLYEAQRRYGEAEPLLQLALEIYREKLGERHPNVAQSLNNLAALYDAQGRYGEAKPLLQLALEIRREQLGERHPDVAQSLNNLAEIYEAQGRYGEAEPLLQLAIEIRREQLGEHHPDVALSLNNLAALYTGQGRNGEAEPLLQLALEIRQEQLGERHPDVAQSLNNLATLYLAQGRYDKAEPLLQLALEIYREQLGERHPNVATNLNSLAALYDAQGRYDKAEPLLQLALEIYREQLGERHPDVATNLNNLAELYEAQGRYDKAEPLLQLAIEIRREKLGERHPDVALSLNNLAALYDAQGRDGEAEPLLQLAIEILREQLGERHPHVATSLHNLATLYIARGDYGDQRRYGEAESLLQLALEIYREQLGERHPSVATSLNSLALLSLYQERYREAEPLLQLALEIYREQLGERHPSVATSLTNLATLYKDQGKYAEAEPLYQLALEILREQLGERHPHVATSLKKLAELYEAQGNTAQVLTYLQASLEIEEQHLDLNLATLADAQRQTYAATISGSTARAISFHLQGAPNSPEAAQLALTTLLRRKGRILDAGTSSLQLLRQNFTPEDRTILDQLADIRRELSALTFNPPPNLPLEEYQTRLTQLETDANQLEATLARRSATFRAQTQPVEIATVQAKLPTNGVLVEYTRYLPYHAVENRWGKPRYAAYLLFGDGNIQAVDLGDAAPIDDALESFRSLLQDPGADLRAGARPQPRPDYIERVTGNIATLIFDPIAPYLANSQHLLISPDSQLNRLPFEALQTETGGDYLVQQYQISYLNTGRDLVKFGIVPPSSAPAVVLANPDYNSADDSVTIARASSSPDGSRAIPERRSTELSQIQVGPLPGTAAEVEAIRPLLNNPTILTTTEATENALKTARNPQILHIATHGFFLADVERIQDSRGGFASISGDRSFAAPVGGVVENPLLRSGLALAGFNPRISGSEDGVLTALEASQLNLSGTQLVVLSACETGLGDVANGEGVYGLRRAFSLAGAETQLMSLWQVSDDGTQNLMARYYEKLMQGMGRSEALRQVQLEAISQEGKYSRPYYWAAFILAGEWEALGK